MQEFIVEIATTFPEGPDPADVTALRAAEAVRADRHGRLRAPPRPPSTATPSVTCNGSTTPRSDSCPSCHGDLRPLLRLADLADCHYNQSVTAARSRHWGTAAEHLAVTLALRPDDVDAWSAA